MTEDGVCSRVIWATRGRSWGFRFLRDGGLDDPLAAYESAFDGIGNAPDVYQRNTEDAALRFSDPEGRRDAAGRTIPHEFVLFAPLAERVESVEDGLALVWPFVRNDFAEIWDTPRK